MNEIRLYPIVLRARDMGNWVDSPRLAKLMWDRIRGETIWYATDCQLLDAETVELFVYDIQNPVTGGIGKSIFSGTFPIAKFGPEAEVLAQAAILEEQTRLAQQEFIRREETARRLKILEIRKELFGE